MSKVKDIIEQLSILNPDEEIFIAYYDREFVAEYFENWNVELTDERYAEVVAEVNSYTKHNQLSYEIIEDAVMDTIHKYEEDADE